jgi:hypothetical protein
VRPEASSARGAKRKFKSAHDIVEHDLREMIEAFIVEMNDSGESTSALHYGSELRANYALACRREFTLTVRHLNETGTGLGVAQFYNFQKFAPSKYLTHAIANALSR